MPSMYGKGSQDIPSLEVVVSSSIQGCPPPQVRDNCLLSRRGFTGLFLISLGVHNGSKFGCNVVDSNQRFQPRCQTRRKSAARNMSINRMLPAPTTAHTSFEQWMWLFDRRHDFFKRRGAWIFLHAT